MSNLRTVSESICKEEQASNKILCSLLSSKLLTDRFRKQYRSYTFILHHDDNHWVLQKRFSDFDHLNNILLTKSATDSRFVPTHFLPSLVLPSKFSKDLSSRQHQLVEYFQVLLDIVYDCPVKEILVFIGLAFEFAPEGDYSKANARINLHLSRLESECETGDIILFKCKNRSSQLQRVVTGAEWDHTGIVVRVTPKSYTDMKYHLTQLKMQAKDKTKSKDKAKDKDIIDSKAEECPPPPLWRFSTSRRGMLCVLECTGEGVTCLPLHDRIKAYDYYKCCDYMAVRRLNIEDTLSRIKRSSKDPPITCLSSSSSQSTWKSSDYSSDIDPDLEESSSDSESDLDDTDDVDGKAGHKMSFMEDCQNKKLLRLKCLYQRRKTISAFLNETIGRAYQFKVSNLIASMFISNSSSSAGSRGHADSVTRPGSTGNRNTQVSLGRRSRRKAVTKVPYDHYYDPSVEGCSSYKLSVLLAEEAVEDNRQRRSTREGYGEEDDEEEDDETVSSSTVTNASPTESNVYDSTHGKGTDGTHSTYFCSELVAAALKAMGVLSMDVRNDFFWPGSFATGYLETYITEGNFYGEEMNINCRVNSVSTISVTASKSKSSTNILTWSPSKHSKPLVQQNDDVCVEPLKGDCDADGQDDLDEVTNLIIDTDTGSFLDLAPAATFVPTI